LFTERAQQTGPNQELYKSIVARLVDVNRRYIQLNTTPAKRAFNRIIHITAINSIRDPPKAMQHIAKAETDLGQLYQIYLGSSNVPSKDRETADTSYVKWLSDTAGNAALSTLSALTGRSKIPPSWSMTEKLQADPNYIANQYVIEKPASIYDRAAADYALPSSQLAAVPFPDAATSGRYLPSYEKQPLQPERGKEPMSFTEYAHSRGLTVKYGTKVVRRRGQRGRRYAVAKSVRASI
jgi:hypothetical protein